MTFSVHRNNGSSSLLSSKLNSLGKGCYTLIHVINYLYQYFHIYMMGS